MLGSRIMEETVEVAEAVILDSMTVLPEETMTGPEEVVSKVTLATTITTSVEVVTAATSHPAAGEVTEDITTEGEMEEASAIRAEEEAEVAIKIGTGHPPP
jgi:hypothetical protein